MADPTTYHRFALQFTSPWNIGNETNHNWHCKFSVSGTIEMGDSDSEATAVALAQPILRLVTTLTSLTAYSYYPSGTAVASSSKEYAMAVHPGTGSAYSAGGGQGQQLEVCILARAPVGKNSKGKPKYLRKWIHDIASGPGGPNTIGPIANPALVLAEWNSGAGPHSVVPVSPSTGVQGTPWTFEQHLYTHQLRRGSKRKVAKASIGSEALAFLEELAKLGVLGGTLAGLADLLP